MNASRRVTTLFARIAEAGVRASTDCENRASVFQKRIGRDGLRRFFVIVLASIAIVKCDIVVTTIARHRATATSLSDLFVGVILALALVANVVAMSATREGMGDPNERIVASRRAAAPWLFSSSFVSLCAGITEFVIRPSPEYGVLGALWVLGALVIFGSAVRGARKPGHRDSNRPFGTLS